MIVFAKNVFFVHREQIALDCQKYHIPQSEHIHIHLPIWQYKGCNNTLMVERTRFPDFLRSIDNLGMHNDTHNPYKLLSGLSLCAITSLTYPMEK